MTSNTPHLWFELGGALGEHVRKAIANPAQPKKHHRVPAFYLRHWMGDQGKIRRTDIDSGRSDLVSPSVVGVGSNFYSIAGAMTPDHANTVEHIYSYFENRTAPLLGRLQSRWILEHDELDLLHWYLAAQMTRGMKFRRTLLERSSFAGPAMALEVGQELEVDLATEYDFPQFDQVAFAIRRMQIEYDGFAKRKLVAYGCPPLLVTSDEPVVPVDHDFASYRAQVGVEDAPILVFPVRPDLLLVSFHDGWPIPALHPLTLDETHQINSIILGYSYQEAYEQPRTSVAQNMWVPPLRQTRLLVTDELPDGTRLVRVTDPGRWTGVAGAPRRVIPRWWSKPSPRYRRSSFVH